MAVTISVSEILTKVIKSFKVQFPMFSAISTDMGPNKLKFNKQAIARIATLPTEQNYDATNGYKPNAADAKGLLTDVPVTINQHKHVPIKLDYIDGISSNISLIDQTAENSAFVLGQGAMNYLLGLTAAANLSQSSVYTVANSDKDMLDNIAGDMNGVGASAFRRFGIVNTGVYNVLEGDSRISSGDYHGQKRTDNAFGHLKNVAGFSNIWEYPLFPNNSENQTGLFGTPESLIFKSGVPDLSDSIPGLNLKNDPLNQEIVTDPETGLTFLALVWRETGTMDIYMTLVWLYGAVCGSQGGSAGDLTDYAGHRLVTA